MTAEHRELWDHIVEVYREARRNDEVTEDELADLSPAEWYVKRLIDNTGWRLVNGHIKITI